MSDYSSLQRQLDRARERSNRRSDFRDQLEAREASDRALRWEKLILATPSPRPETAKAVIDGLRQVAADFNGSPNITQLEDAAMHLLVDAIHAGAFCGEEWLLWRTRLAVNPHLLNAAELLAQCNPKIKHADLGRGYQRSATAATVLADLIESFANIARDEQPAKALSPTPETTRTLILDPETNGFEWPWFTISVLGGQAVTPLQDRRDCQDGIDTLRALLRAAVAKLFPAVLTAKDFELAQAVRAILVSGGRGSVEVDRLPVTKAIELIERLPASPAIAQQNAPVGAIAPAQPTAIKDHHEEILQALLELKAFDQTSRKSAAEIAIRALPPGTDPALLKRPISELKKLGLLNTKGGRKGGAWLEAEGRQRAVEASKR